MKRNIRIVSFFLFTLLAAACARQELSFDMTGIHRYEQGCDSLQGAVCASVNLRYPVFKGEDEKAVAASNALIGDILYGAMGTADTLCSRFFTQWGNIRDSLAADSCGQEEDHIHDEDEFPAPWYYNAVLEAAGTRGRLLSFRYRVATNSPFAVVSPRKYYTLDAESGMSASAGGVFTDTIGLRRMLTRVFLQQVGATNGIPLAEQGINLPEDGLLPLTDDFALDRDGAVFHYDMNKIAPNILPEGDVFLPENMVGSLYK